MNRPPVRVDRRLDLPELHGIDSDVMWVDFPPSIYPLTTSTAVRTTPGVPWSHPSTGSTAVPPRRGSVVITSLGL